MMKKDKLYTANKWNQPLFMDTNRVENIFWPGGDLGNISTSGFKASSGKALSTGTIGKVNDYYKKITSDGSESNGSWGKAASSLAGSLAPMATPLISDGYSTGGVGEGIAAAGSAVGDAVGMIPGVGALAAPIVKIGSAIAGGLVNRTWGTKKNQKNINAITENATNARNTGNALVNATSSGDFMDTAGSMTSSLGFNTTDLVKGGWAGSAKRKARKQGQKFLNAEQGALAAQTHGMMMGAENVDSNLDDAVMENFYDLGGPVGFSPMTGALGIMQTDKYINAINNRTNAITRNNTLVNTSSSFSPLGNAFAEGGGIHIKPSHKGLFTEKANRAGMGVQAYASHVLANKEDYPSSTVKQANFAKNAAGWKHDAGGSLEGAFLDEFGKDPLGAVMRYNQGLEAIAAQREAQREAAAQQAAYDDMQKRMLAAETQNQGLQSMLDSQGLTIQALMEAQKQNTNYADGWKERTPIVSQQPADFGNMGTIREGLRKRGVNNVAHQDAIIANIMVESGGNPNAKNANSSARGYLQWLKARHPSAWDPESQLDYIANTYNKLDGTNWLDKNAYNKFMNTTDSLEAARLFRRYYERPEKSTYNMADKYIHQMYGKKKAFGGELGTNGTDFTTGLLEINTGSSHEDNPHEGVQLGLDEQGIPNLVEEGETVYNDYVFSNRLSVPSFMRKQLSLGGSMKDEITFAAASKKIAEAGKERPNNPMDMDYMDDALGKLAQVQEAERMRMQAERQNDEMERINALPMEGMMQGAMGIEAAYGGQLGNIFEGKGNKPQIVYRPNDKSFARRILGDNAVTDAIESAGKFVEDPLGTMFGDNIEAAMDWLANASEPAMNKFFATDFGQKVAQYIVDNENSSSKSPYVTEAGKNATIGKAAARAWGRAHKGVVNAAKKSIKNLADIKNTKKVKPQGNTLPVKAQSSAVTNTRPTSLATRAANTGLARQTGLVRQTGLGPANQTGLTTSSNTTFTPWTVGPLAEAAAIAAGITGANRMFGNSSGDALADGDPSKVFGSVFNSTNGTENPGQAAGNPIVSGINDPYTNWLIGQLPSDNATPKKATTPTEAVPSNGNDKLAAEAPLTIPTLPGYENWTPYKEGALDSSTPSIEEIRKGASEVGVSPEEYNKTRRTNEKVKPYPTWMRYAPVVGSGIMTLTDLLGLTNKPDYTYANKIEAAANRLGYAPNIQYKPIGNYLRYSPMDIWAEQNRLNANSRATDRAILNSGAVQGSKMAGLLANGYNDQLASGQLYRQALEYNDNKRHQVADFNRRTDMFNSQMGLEADMANARYRQQAASAQLNGLAQAAAIRDAIDNRVGAARSANITNLLNNLGNIGRENFVMNQINSDRTRPYKGRLNGTSYYYNGTSAFGGEIERYKKNKKQGRRSK